MTASTIKALPVRFVTKEVSAEKLARYYLPCIEAGAHLNAFTHVDAEATLAQARAADARITVGNAAPLTDVPIAHKDVLVVRGWRVTVGSKMLDNYVNPFDATVVERLGTAGVVTPGKINMDEFAMGSSNENLAFGVAKNPWNLEHVPSSLSGGSAAVVAVDLASATTRTDTGDSVHQLASFSDITGIKPTYGRVLHYGMIAFISLPDQGGSVTHTAEDCALLLFAMAGFDPCDSTSLEPGRGGDVEGFGRLLGQLLRGADAARPLAGLHTGLPKEYSGEDLADDVRTMVRIALAELEKPGAALVGISLSETELSVPTYCAIAPAEASSNLSRSDGVCCGHRAAEYRDLADMYHKPRAEGFGWEVKRRILVGAYILFHGYYDIYYLQAQKICRIIAQDFQSVLVGANRQCDVIMGLAVLTVAWKLGEKTSDPVQMYLADIFTLSTSLAGPSGMSMPVGFDANGLSAGLQIIGSYFEEARTPQIAHAFQQATDWHHRQPVA